MAASQPKVKKKTWDEMTRKEKLLGTVVSIVIILIAIGLVGGIVNAITGGSDNTKNKVSTTKTDSKKSQPVKAETKPKKQTAKATQSQSESKSSTTPAPAPATKTQTTPTVSLASQVQAAYLKQIGYSSIAELNLDKDDVVGSPENEITSFSDENNGVVKVNVQDSLTSAQAKQIGQDVMISASDIKSLKWIDVRGTNGTTAEVSRQDAGLAN